MYHFHLGTRGLLPGVQSAPMVQMGQSAIVGYPSSAPMVSESIGCASGQCATCDTGACGNYDDCLNPCNFPHYYFRSDVLYWWRDGDNGLAYQSGQAFGFPYIQSTRDLDFDPELGGRITFGTRIDDNLILEGSVFGLQRHSVRDDFFDTPDVFITRGIDNQIDDVDGQSLFYRSRTYSGELNLKRYVYFNPNVMIHAGIRYISHREYLDLDEIGTVGNQVSVGTYSVRTHNNMIGPQFGLEYMQQRGRFELNMLGRIGLLTNPNSSRLERAVTVTANGPFVQSESDDGTDWTLMAEFGAWGSYKLNNRLLVRGGYHFLFLDGAAIATEQRFPNAVNNNGNNNSYLTNDNSSFYLHGPFFGIEYRMGYCCY